MNNLQNIPRFRVCISQLQYHNGEFMTDEFPTKKFLDLENVSVSCKDIIIENL